MNVLIVVPLTYGKNPMHLELEQENDLCTSGNDMHKNLNQNAQVQKGKKRSEGQQRQDPEYELLTSVENSETLIEAVAKRSCLWDIRIPVEERGPKQRELAWDQIASEFNGNFIKFVEYLFTVDSYCTAKNFLFCLFLGKWLVGELKDRWRTLRDDFRRAYNKENEYTPSGSGAKKKKAISFRYYEQMMFLADVIDYEYENILLKLFL